MELVKELLKQGADMLVKDSEDMIPLDYACVCEEREIIDYMVVCLSQWMKSRLRMEHA